MDITIKQNNTTTKHLNKEEQKIALLKKFPLPKELRPTRYDAL